MNPSIDTRMPEVLTEIDGTRIEVFPVAPNENVLCGLITDIFQSYWQRIHFGTHVQGGVWEFAVDGPPTEVRMSNGYLTVDFGRWHAHLCIGAYTGQPGKPVPPEVARARRTSRAEFYRRLMDDGTPGSWGFRMFNGNGEVQLTVFFPNPFVGPEGKRRAAPDWDDLAMWDDLRRRYAGIEPDPSDRGSPH
jgi:hypothetical protein